MLTTAPYFVCVCDQDYIYILDKIKNLQNTHGNSNKIIIDKITNMEKHVEDPRTSSWIRSNNMKCSKHILTTAPYVVCVYKKDINIYISLIRSKTWKNTWKFQETHHG